mgnify:CR=1 FL=1
MSSYAMFFDYNNKTYRLPTNPEQIQTTSVQANQKYEVLKLGQIVVPTHMELKQISFECEFPRKKSNYTEVQTGLKDADYYVKLFEKWRKKLVPVRFIAGMVTSDEGSNSIDDVEIDIDKAINTLVLIEELTIIEKAGEEGDKYIAFTLTEYKEFGVGITIDSTTGKKKKAAKTTAKKTNPKSTGSYTVQKGDNLWNIAKKYDGDGSQYTKIYNANKDKIKNPSLIYPGQKLKIPS